MSVPVSKGLLVVRGCDKNICKGKWKVDLVEMLDSKCKRSDEDIVSAMGVDGN